MPNVKTLISPSDERLMEMAKGYLTHYKSAEVGVPILPLNNHLIACMQLAVDETRALNQTALPLIPMHSRKFYDLIRLVSTLYWERGDDLPMDIRNRIHEVLFVNHYG